MGAVSMETHSIRVEFGTSRVPTKYGKLLVRPQGHNMPTLPRWQLGQLGAGPERKDTIYSGWSKEDVRVPVLLPFLYPQFFSRIAQPLYQLLTAKEKSSTESGMWSMKRKPTKKRKEGTLASQTLIEWTQNHQATLNNLIDHLAKPSILGFPDFTQAFVLHCDASQEGLGAVLYQRRMGRW